MILCKTKCLFYIRDNLGNYRTDLNRIFSIQISHYGGCYVHILMDRTTVHDILSNKIEINQYCLVKNRKKMVNLFNGKVE